MEGFERTTVQLQGLGRFTGTRVSDLRPGDVLVWNYGHRSTVVSCDAKPGTASYVLTERSHHDDSVHTRTKRGTTLVVRDSREGD